VTDPTRVALTRVAEFLTGLSATELTELAAGRARLALLPVPPPDPAGPTTARVPAAGPLDGAGPASPAGAVAVDLAGAHAALAAMSRRDEGTAYLAAWPARELRALAAHAGLRGVGGLRKTDLVDRIVDRLIGFRLNSTAVRGR
jgi:hypothetical protein